MLGNCRMESFPQFLVYFICFVTIVIRRYQDIQAAKLPIETDQVKSGNIRMPSKQIILNSYIFNNIIRIFVEHYLKTLFSKL